MSFSLNYFMQLVPDALYGIWVTIQVSVVAIAFGLFGGLVLAALRTLRVPFLDLVILTYIEIIRNTPFLAQLFLIYFGLPSLGVKLPEFVAAATALAMWTCAYSSENFRAGLEAPSNKVREAGLALGMKPLLVFFMVILPLGVRTAFPALVNTIIEALKTSAYLSFIAFPELTYILMNDITANLRVLEGFTLLLIGYVSLVFILSTVLKSVERNFAIARTV